jgi:hypothetical protein
MAEEDVDCSAEEPQSFIEASLGSSKGSLQVEENRPFEPVPRTLLKLLVRLCKSFLRSLEVEPDPAGVPDEGPGSRPEVRDPLGAIPSAVQVIGEA